MVERGLLKGDDAKPPNDAVWLWLPELFKVLVAEKANPESRRLAACWYYTATEVDFGNEDEEEEDLLGSEDDMGDMNDIGNDSESEQATESKKASTVKASDTTKALAGELMSDDDDDLDFDLDNEAEEVESEDFSEDGEDDDDEDDNGEGSFADDDFDSEDAEANADQDAMGALAGALMGQPIQMPDEDTPESQEARKVILEAVEQLHAFLPSPETHLPFFKRMLKKYQTADDRWFPWGKPPLQHMIDILTNDMAEDAKGDFIRESLAIFASYQSEDGEEQQ